jgi:hypothetical protein
VTRSSRRSGDSTTPTEAPADEGVDASLPNGDRHGEITPSVPWIHG